MDKNKLKENFEKSCNDYIDFFCEKQEIEFEFWVSDIVGETSCFCGGQYFFDISDIIFDVNTDKPKGLILEWQNYVTNYRIMNDSEEYINYESYSKGKRFESKDNKDWINGGANYK